MTRQLRCAPATEQDGVDPIGTAPASRGFLVVAWPLPWPRDAGDVEPLAGVAGAARERGLRLQLVVPDAGPVATLHQRAADGWFGGYDRTIVPAGPPAVAAGALLAGAGEPDDGRAEVLVCGHGRRDACCGSLGTTVALDLSRTCGPDVLVRRTSHLGGHRFAPTVLLLPAGLAWAWMRPDDVVTVLARRGEPSEILGRYRGSPGIGPGPAQVVERYAFAATGWRWLDLRRRAVDVGDGIWRVEAYDPTIGAAAPAAWEGHPTTARTYLVPPCGRAEGAAEPYDELTCADVVRVR